MVDLSWTQHQLNLEQSQTLQHKAGWIDHHHINEIQPVDATPVGDGRFLPVAHKVPLSLSYGETITSQTTIHTPVCCD